MTDSDNLIKTIIKGRQVTYYLTTEEDLNNIKSSGLLGDIFAVLTSLAIGGIISVIITKATDIELKPETLNILDLLLYVFLIVALIFGMFTAHFYIKTFKTIEKIKESGAVKSLESVDEGHTELETQQKGKDGKLQIIKANYGTNNKVIDVTEELRKMIVGNKLETIASNNIKGDPDHGTVKKLSIKYKFNGITVTKEFREKDKVIIP